jgi:hypothetical protein
MWASAVAEKQRVDTERAALKAERETLSAVAIWHGASPEDRESDRMAWCRDRVKAAYPDGVLPRPHRLAAMIEDLEDQESRLTAAWTAADKTYSHSEQKQTSARAQELAKRQPAIVERIADALSQLSKAFADEEKLHVELQATSPVGQSLFLPHIVNPELGSIGRFGQWWSAAEAWRRRMVQIGYLK